MFPVEIGFEQSYVENARQRTELAATGELNFVAQRLMGQLGSHLAAVEGLAAYIASNPDLDQAEFDAFAAAIFSRHGFLISMAAAPDLVVDKIYPLQGNEAALGLNYLDTPSQRSAVLRARDKQTPVLAGPVELVQGGVALIARLPVYVRADDGTSRFWGIVSATMDANKIFAAAGLEEKGRDRSLSVASSQTHCQRICAGHHQREYRHTACQASGDAHRIARDRESNRYCDASRRWKSRRFCRLQSACPCSRCPRSRGASTGSTADAGAALPR